MIRHHAQSLESTEPCFAIFIVPRTIWKALVGVMMKHAIVGAACSKAAPSPKVAQIRARIKPFDACVGEPTPTTRENFVLSSLSSTGHECSHPQFLHNFFFAADKFRRLHVAGPRWGDD